MIRTPFFIFVLIGLSIWGVESYIGSTQEASQAKQLEVSQADIEKIKKQWRQRNGAAPNAQELQYLINQYVEDELLVKTAVDLGLVLTDPVIRMRLYKNIQFLHSADGDSEEDKIKQAIKMGMQKTDPVVRRRLIQVMEERIRSSIALPAASEQELQEYLLKHEERYKLPAIWSFQHILFSRNEGQEAAHGRASEALLSIASLTEEQLGTLGDASLIPRSFNNSTEKHVVRYLGEGFIARLEQLPTDVWQGPIQSAFGWHLVKIDAYSQGELPKVSAIKDRITADWRADELEKKLRQRKKELRTSYQIILEPGVS